ncbi:hypothetical protein [Wolbachia endosymbiont (group A) of Sphaerophoria taeniata]|nr:hypothetical protein [Wolbachia endosymbiont (group A) of Sphaerophoria taeniata]
MCFNVRLATFTLTNLARSQCLGTGMTAVLRHTAIHSYVIPRFIRGIS